MRIYNHMCAQACTHLGARVRARTWARVRARARTHVRARVRVCIHIDLHFFFYILRQKILQVQFLSDIQKIGFNFFRTVIINRKKYFKNQK